MSGPRLSSTAPARIAWMHQLRSAPTWSVLTTRQTRSCEKAYAPAAVRDDTPSLAKMFCRWRATVCSLTTSSARSPGCVLPVGHQPQHLQLAGGQAVAGSVLRLRRRGAERGERAARRLELQRGRVAVAEGRAGRTDQRPRPRGLVRRLELLPHAPRRGAARPARRGLARGELDRAAGLCRHRAEHVAALLVGDPLAARSQPRARRPASPTASMISTYAGRSRARVRPLVRPRPARAGSRPPRRRRRPARAAAARGRAAARARAGSRRGRPPRPRRARPAADAPRPAGSTPRRPPSGSVACSRRRPARRASSSASGHAPCSSRISARWVRHRPVKATMSGCCSHQRVSAAVHSWARRRFVGLLAAEDHAAVDDAADDRRQLARASPRASPRPAAPGPRRFAPA